MLAVRILALFALLGAAAPLAEARYECEGELFFQVCSNPNPPVECPGSNGGRAWDYDLVVYTGIHLAVGGTDNCHQQRANYTYQRTMDAGVSHGLAYVKFVWTTNESYSNGETTRTCTMSLVYGESVRRTDTRTVPCPPGLTPPHGGGLPGLFSG